jgi:hypothetical protein
MRTLIRSILLAAAASLLVASTAFASHCVNASKEPGAGAQVIIDANTSEVLWVSTGVVKRIEGGIIDFDTGEGFHGLIGLDLDSDGVADLTTWVGVGPDGEAVPWQAQVSGPACQGVTDIATYFVECLSA